MIYRLRGNGFWLMAVVVVVALVLVVLLALKAFGATT